jgi:Cft2 family RNA processing exonuclease
LIEVPRADLVVMESTFGRPHYVFPPAEQVVAEIHAFCSRALDEGSVPVLFGYTLGKSQELLAQLAGHPAPLMLHPGLREFVTIYEAFGVRFPEYRIWEPGVDVAGHVLFCPTGARRSSLLESLPRKRTAYVSGWALDRNAGWRLQADASFPLSDHADYPDLVEYVRLTGATRVLTLHGFAAEFAQDLRLLGYDAAAVEAPAQLALF